MYIYPPFFPTEARHLTRIRLGAPSAPSAARATSPVAVLVNHRKRQKNGEKW